MPDDAIEPISETPAVHPVSAGGHYAGMSPTHEGRIVGEVIAVHRRTSAHPESGHLLDATVGAVAHSEVVVRIERGDVDGLVGKRVAIHFLT